ncbi:MAG TPA: polysaccharide deacetylase family protein [Rubricoccaceae bacterium]|nr:polysaccharide deacetylase family protein [Rubricoccaceae bacterium]
MKALVPARVRRAVRRLKERWTPRGLILMYHRVGAGGADPWGLRVSPEHFAEHLDVLTRRGSPMALSGLAEAVDRGRLPRRAVAVTFDDGYADNLHAAVPLLERHDVPATVFLTTGYLGGQREFWWDALEQVLLHDAPLPACLRVTVGGEPFAWASEGEGAGGHAPASQGWRCWEEPPTERQALYLALWQRLQKQPEAERWAVLDGLARWAGVSLTVRPDLRALTDDEVTRLASGSLVEAGAHTVTHPPLSALPLAAQRDEVARSKACLEARLGRPVRSFSYPHGEFTPETVSVVREAGFASACTTVPAPVTGGADPLLLPRLFVEDWSGEAFERVLERHLGGQ